MAVLFYSLFTMISHTPLQLTIMDTIQKTSLSPHPPFSSAHASDDAAFQANGKTRLKLFAAIMPICSLLLWSFLFSVPPAFAQNEALPDTILSDPHDIIRQIALTHFVAFDESNFRPKTNSKIVQNSSTPPILPSPSTLQIPSNYQIVQRQDGAFIFKSPYHAGVLATYYRQTLPDDSQASAGEALQNWAKSQRLEIDGELKPYPNFSGTNTRAFQFSARISGEVWQFAAAVRSEGVSSILIMQIPDAWFNTYRPIIETMFTSMDHITPNIP